MEQELVEFLERQRVGVLAVKMPDGTPHAAAVHFAYKREPFEFIFITHPSYRKCEPLHKSETTPASFVIGTSDEEMKTLQLDGTASFKDTPEIRAIYNERFPGVVDEYTEDVFVVFTPSWWRYTDWDKPEGKTMLTSDGEVSVEV